MQFNQTGKLTPKPVAQENIDATVEPSSQGITITKNIITNLN